MSKQGDISPQPDPTNGLGATSGAEDSENAHYDDWLKLSSSEQSKTLEEFFKRWEAPAPDLSKCPPEAELLKAAKNKNAAEWSHINGCESCKSLVDLVSDPNRVRIPVSRILAEASRKAWEIEHSEREQSFIPRHVQAVYKSMQPVYRQLAVGASVAVLVIVAWIGIQSYRPTPPSQLVAFDNRPVPIQGDTEQFAKLWFDRTKDILEAPNLNPTEKAEHLQPLQSEKPKVATAIAQADPDSTKRAETAVRIAKYNNQVTALKDSPNAQNVDTKDLSFPKTEDSKAVNAIWLAFGSTGPIVFNREDPETAKNILKAAEFTKIATIEPKPDNQTIVTIEVPDSYRQSRELARDLDFRLQLLKSQGLDVRVAAYTPPPNPKLKAINR